MEIKINCWEFKKCKKEDQPDENSNDYCCIPFDQSMDKLFEGKNGGRVCWGLIGTCCGSKRQKSITEKLDLCSKCDFYKFLKIDDPEFRNKKKEIMSQLMKRNQKYRSNTIEMRDISSKIN